MHIRSGLVLLLIATTTSLAVADECDFTTSPLRTNWAGLPRAAMSCMQAIPLRASENTNTIAVVRKVFEGYAFSDLVTANVAPYRLNVDWATELTRIASTSYTGDYAFHSDLTKLFNSIGDAHLVYIKPGGYLKMFYYFPFSIISRKVGDQQKFYAAPGSVSDTVWRAVCGCTPNLPDYYGLEITKIDSIDVKDWLLAFAKKGGIYMDPGVQMNNILEALKYGLSLGLYETPASRITYTFSGTGDVSFDYHFQYTSRPNNIAAVEEFNHDTTTRSRSLGRRESDGFGQNSLAQAEKSVIENLENVIRSKRFSRDPTSLRLLEIAQNHVDALKMTQTASADFGVKLTEASSKRGFNMEQFLANHRVPLAHDRLHDISAAIVAAMDLEAGFDREAAYAETLRKIDASAPIEQSAHVSRKKDGAATIETPVVTGDTKLLSLVSRSTNAGIAVFNDSIVLKLKSFSLDTDDDFIVALKEAHTLRSTYNTQQLIIDVSGNGGGLICLNYLTLSFLVEQWRNHATFGDDVLYSPYDWRFSPLNEALWSYSSIFGGEVSPTTGRDLGKSVHDSPRSITYGSRTSQYSKLFHWNLCSSRYYEPETVDQVHAFEKIIILTDGTCGSSCAYFLSHLRSTNKVRVVSYGGADGLPLATSSFAGGNVYQYDAIVASAISGGYATSADLKYMDHNAIASFNFRSNYHAGASDTSLPRQFIREEADWHVSYWEPLGVDIYSPTRAPSATSLQVMANLYASVTPLFNLMPTNLARISSASAPTSTPSSPPSSLRPFPSPPASPPSQSPGSVPIDPSPSSPSLPSPTLPPSPPSPASPPSSPSSPPSSIPTAPSNTPLAASNDAVSIPPLLTAPILLAVIALAL